MDQKDFPPRKPSVAIAIGAPEPKEATFKAPEGFDLSGKEPGSTMEVVCEVTIMDGGMLKINSVNGIPIGGDEAPKDNDRKPDDSFASRVMPDEGEEGE
jgi:hypothetical protein